VSAGSDLSKLTKGFAFPGASFAVTPGELGAYLDAVGDDAFPALGPSDGVAPMALAAFALRTLLAGFRFPPGLLHTGEEIEFVRPARVGEPLRCDSTVTQSSDRQGHRFATVEQRVSDAAGAPLLVARTALVAPLGDRNGAS